MHSVRSTSQYGKSSPLSQGSLEQASSGFAFAFMHEKTARLVDQECHAKKDTREEHVLMQVPTYLVCSRWIGFISERYLAGCL